VAPGLAELVDLATGKEASPLFRAGNEGVLARRDASTGATMKAAARTMPRSSMQEQTSRPIGLKIGADQRRPFEKYGFTNLSVAWVSPLTGLGRAAPEPIAPLPELLPLIGSEGILPSCSLK
jgi:hypothetical protein